MHCYSCDRPCVGWYCEACGDLYPPELSCARNGVGMWMQEQPVGAPLWATGGTAEAPSRIKSTKYAAYYACLSAYLEMRADTSRWSLGPCYDGDLNGAWVMYCDGAHAQSSIDDLRQLGISVSTSMANALFNSPSLDVLLSRTIFVLSEWDDHLLVSLVGGQTGGVCDTGLAAALEDALHALRRRALDI